MSEAAMRMEKKKRNEDFAVRNEDRSAMRKNHTGIPMQLKDRIERSTGLSLHDVRVHYNSDLPMKLGMVRANAMHSSGVALNTDARLERQADEIGAGKRVVIV